MNTGWLGVLALIPVLVLQKKFPQTWTRLQLPIYIAVSSLSLVMIVFIIVGTGQVVSGDINTTGKVLFILFAAAYIAVLAWANYRFWSEWFRKRKPDK